jgi:hypothetical protein
MAHYAFLDSNNIVTEVIPGRNEWEIIDGITDWEQAYSEIRGQVCKRTSYNNNIRYNYAGIGYTYDAERDAFIAPEPTNAIGFDETTCRWITPEPEPRL